LRVSPHHLIESPQAAANQNHPLAGLGAAERHERLIHDFVRILAGIVLRKTQSQNTSQKGE
jgi:hypothetical protein